jgi:hypothetical protein
VAALLGVPTFLTTMRGPSGWASCVTAPPARGHQTINPDGPWCGCGNRAGDLLLDPIRAELRRRVQTTSLEPVAAVTAELGVWAGAVGAAVHGAERDAA